MRPFQGRLLDKLDNIFVKPSIEKEKASELLSSKKGLLFGQKRLPLQKIELIYIPYYLFKASVLVTGKKLEVYLSVDAIGGTFGLFTEENLAFEKSPAGEFFDFAIAAEKAQIIAREEYRWFLIQHSLRKKNPPVLEYLKEYKKIYFPYWVGYYKEKKGYDFRAIDGVSGKLEGIKMRRVFLLAFSQKR